MERKLPVYEIEGTPFIVTLSDLSLTERDNPNNKLYFWEMDEATQMVKGKDVQGYLFPYNKANRCMAYLKHEIDGMVFIPEMRVLDPIGMATKYGKPIEDMERLNDFQIMVDLNALHKREAGQMVTIDIKGQIFYVDHFLKTFRPKDDVLSKGLPFKDLEDYFRSESLTYVFPYNPKTKSIELPDVMKTLTFPKHLIVVEIHPEWQLDRYGYNKHRNLPEYKFVKFTDVILEHKAEVVPWKRLLDEESLKIFMKEQEKRNADKQASQERKENDKPKKGRKM